jgi:hypothetical protein
LDEITENTVLYHRSMDKYKVGDIINPTSKFGSVKDSSHWLSKKFTEKKLESYREKMNPNAPSRFQCVFCTVVPRSAFTGKGYLYEVKPKGKFLATLSYLINKIDNEFDRGRPRGDETMWPPEKKNYPSDITYQLAYAAYEEKENDWAWWSSKDELEKIFEWYWKGVNVGGGFKKNAKWVEVLCEQAVVAGVGGEASYDFLKAGDHVELLRDVTTDHFYGHGSSGNKLLPQDEVQRIVKDFNGVKDEKSFVGNSWKLTIPKGTKARVKNALVDQNRIKDFNADDYQGPFTTPYRRLNMIPDGYDFYFDAHAFLFSINYSAKKKTKTSDVFKKI